MKLDLSEILLYRYAVNGISPDGTFIKQYYKPEQLAILRKNANSLPIPWNPLRFETYFNLGFEHLPDKLTVPVSGGVDSTFVLMKALEMKKEVECINIKFKTYDESERAKEVCEALNVPLKVIEVKEEEVSRDFPEICRKMLYPHERGSNILSYYVYKNSYYPILSAETMDVLMAPSLSESQSLKLNEPVNSHQFNKAIMKLDTNEFRNLTGTTPHFVQPPKARDALTSFILFDHLVETSSYYRPRYYTYSNVEVFAPCQNFPVVAYTIGCHQLHAVNNKYYLRQIVQRRCLSKNIRDFSENPKGLMKVEPELYDFLIQKFWDEDFAKKFVNLKALANLQPHKQYWTKLLLTISAEWVKQHVDD